MLFDPARFGTNWNLQHVSAVARHPKAGVAVIAQYQTRRTVMDPAPVDALIMQMYDSVGKAPGIILLQIGKKPPIAQFALLGVINYQRAGTKNAEVAVEQEGTPEAGVRLPIVQRCGPEDSAPE